MRVLKVARIVVLGHAQCGGVQAMVEGRAEGGPRFRRAVDGDRRAGPAANCRQRHRSAADALDHCETEVVRLSLANLATFPWIAEAVAAGRLALHGFRFAIRTGVLERLEGDRFVPVE